MSGLISSIYKQISTNKIEQKNKNRAFNPVLKSKLSKLSELQELEMITKYETGKFTQKQLQLEYGISHNKCYSILKGKFIPIFGFKTNGNR